MSKKRGSELKDNNISSKLLGTNVQDINIEKFREVTAGKQKYQLGGKLTLPLLKTLTNKFAPEIMFTVTLPDQGLTNLEALEECENLMVLNVAGNSITSMEPLKRMKQLKFLNVANNAVSSLEPLKLLVKLVNLHLEGNNIKTTEALRPLTNCELLRNMYLQTISGNSVSPVCSQAGYRTAIFELLTQLKRLDGVPIGVELNNGVELVRKNKKEFKMEIKNNGPFYSAKYPSLLLTNYPPLQGEPQLKKSIADCRSAINSLEIRLKAVMIK